MMIRVQGIRHGINKPKQQRAVMETQLRMVQPVIWGKRRRRWRIGHWGRGK